MILSVHKSILDDIQELKFLIAMHGYHLDTNAIVHIENPNSVLTSGIEWGYDDFDVFTWLGKVELKSPDFTICTFTHTKNLWPFSVRSIIVIHNIVSTYSVATEYEKLCIVKKEDNLLIVVPDENKYKDTYSFIFYDNLRIRGFEEYKDLPFSRIMSEDEYDRYYLKSFKV